MPQSSRTMVTARAWRSQRASSAMPGRGIGAAIKAGRSSRATDIVSRGRRADLQSSGCGPDRPAPKRCSGDCTVFNHPSILHPTPNEGVPMVRLLVVLALCSAPVVAWGQDPGVAVRPFDQKHGGSKSVHLLAHVVT